MWLKGKLFVILNLSSFRDFSFGLYADLARKQKYLQMDFKTSARLKCTSIKIQEFSFHYHKPRRKTEKINLYVIPFSRKFKELLACGSGELFSYSTRKNLDCY